MKSARRARAIRGSRASNSPPAEGCGWDDEMRRVSCGSKGKTAAERGGCRCFNTPPTQGRGRVKRPGRPGDGDAKIAADREVCQGDFAFVHTSNALSTQGHRGSGVRVIRTTGTQKPPPTAKSVRAVGACPRFKHQSQKKRRQAGKMCRGLRAKTQKPPLAARRVRAILGLPTLQRLRLPNGGGASDR